MRKHGKTLLISEKPIEQKLTLKGKEGYDNAIEVLNKLCREITGVEEARSLTQEDMVNIEYWKDTKKKDLIFGKDYEFRNWVASRCVRTYGDYCDFAVRYMYSGSVGAYYMYYSRDDYDYGSLALRPVVSLSSKKKKYDR